ncbi:MAG: Ni/Fe-hydrogenase cytochrome b subunit [Vicinamibacterales bacterium]
MTATPKALGGPIVTRPFLILLSVFTAGCMVILWRFLFGLGATTALNDGYPWGLWITFDVVVGTALGCGGYAIAILVYVLNRGVYHPLVRPALLTSALGYSLAGFAVVLDVGRYWNLYKALLPWLWNTSSVLLEVALCIMAYVVVLWIELSPTLRERWPARVRQPVPEMELHPRLGPLMADGGRPLRRVRPSTWMIWILALGLLLPTMHQSSLGSVLLIAGTKVHALWHTPLLPLLFLISCIGMGYAVVVCESALASVAFRRPPELRLLNRLSTTMAGVLGLFVLVRLADLIVRGQIGAAFAFDRYGLLFASELALFVAPMWMLLARRERHSLGDLFRAAMLMLLAGVVYRFNAYLVAFNPGPSWAYFPSVGEMLVTAGILAFEVMAYLVIVKRFPVLAGVGATARPRRQVSPVEVTP